MVPVIGGHEQCVVVLERDGVIQRVKDMVIGLDRKVGCPSDHVRVVGRRNLERGEHFDDADRRLWCEPGRHRRNFGQPMHGLQRLEFAEQDGLDNGKCLFGVRFACGVPKQPFENHARVEHDDHGRPIARDLRASAAVKVGRLRRALFNWRNNRSRLILSCRSRTAR